MPGAPDRLQTERLVLRPMTMDDGDALHELWNDSEVRRYLWDDRTVDRSKTDQIISQSLSLREQEGAGLWAVEDKDSGDLIGFGGFWYFFEPPRLQILYGLAPDHWGMGLATELAQCLINYGFEQLGLDEVVGSTDKPNISSQRVMEKAGMQFQKRERHGGLDTVFYSISKPG